jgi:hypothetical protein
MIITRRLKIGSPEKAVRQILAPVVVAMSWLCLQGLISNRASAQIASAGWLNAINSLTDANNLLPTITVPAGVLPGAEGSAIWNLGRASLMFSAADVAKHNQFPIRSGQLFQEAGNSLIAAQQSGLTPEQGSQCAYLLGYLAEHVNNDLASAASYYQQALALDSSNSRAANALLRVQMYLARAAKT